MGKSVEKSGKTVNDAIAAALDELMLSIDDVHVDIINEGKAGLFGLLSGKPAKVRVSELDEGERQPQPSAGADSAAFADGGGDYAAETEEREAYATEGGAEEADADGAEAAATDEAGEEDGGEYADDLTYDYDYESNRAIEYLDRIFHGIHVTAGMNAELTEEGFLINVESDDSGILIGHRGETLDAVQYLLNLYINKGRRVFIRVTVDVENYKKKREAALIRLAGQMADKVVRLKRNLTMDAMNSYERRIIHSVLQNHPKVETYSVGEDPNRKVVITLKNKGGYSSR
jgi:spoIIIJ-associated protein